MCMWCVPMHWSLHHGYLPAWCRFGVLHSLKRNDVPKFLQTNSCFHCLCLFRLGNEYDSNIHRPNRKTKGRANLTTAILKGNCRFKQGLLIKLLKVLFCLMWQSFSRDSKSTRGALTDFPLNGPESSSLYGEHLCWSCYFFPKMAAVKRPI